MSTLAPRPGADGAPSREERELQQLARDFLLAFYAALRVLKLYPLENQAVQNALRELEVAGGGLMAREGGIEVRSVGDFLFVNDVRLRFDLGSYATFGALGRALRRHGIGQMAAESGVDAAEWAAVLALLLTEPDAADPFGRFTARLQHARVRRVGFGPEAAGAAESGTLEHAREAARRTYSQSVAVAREVMNGLRIGKGVSLRRVKRAVQSIVDQVLTNETSVIGMTTLREYDEYTFTHSVNVCIFSVALGKKLGLTKAELYELGLGALLHDVGKLRMPLEVVNKASRLDAAEWALMQEHPTEGLLTLFGMRGFADLPLRPMLMAYEHHMKMDQTGYPTSRRPRQPTLFSRIVAVADGFDAATSRRSYQANPLQPDEVLREMRDSAGRGYDPLLVKGFISMTGIYPVGSVVILDTFELAVVVARNPRPQALHQPIVRILFNEMGMPLEPAPTVDLAEPDPASGRPQRSIIKTTDPERYGINVSEYFV